MTAVPKPQYYTAEEYFALPDAPNGVVTELHEGEIVALARPTRMHQRIASRAFARIDAFIQSNGGPCSVDQEIDVKLTEDTVVVPDVAVTCDPSKLDEKRCNGAPDWVIEILSTNRSNDLIDKQGLYQKYGVREYWIVDPVSQKTLVYFFEKSDLPDIYTFDTPIPVGIYDKALSIRIADLLA